MDYKILRAYTIVELEKTVIKYLNEGYQLTGGVSTDGVSVYQAVYKMN